MVKYYEIEHYTEEQKRGRPHKDIVFSPTPMTREQLVSEFSLYHPSSDVKSVWEITANGAVLVEE